jgi:hypothetical protein
VDIAVMVERDEIGSEDAVHRDQRAGDRGQDKSEPVCPHAGRAVSWVF